MRKSAIVIVAVTAVLLLSTAAVSDELLHEFTGTHFMWGVTSWRGNVWAGIENGLVKWDKNSGASTMFTPRDGAGAFARSFVTDSEDRLWYATQDGVQCFDGASFTTYTTDNSGLPTNFINAVDFDEDGVLWAGTTEGLCRFDGSTWTTYPVEVDGVDVTQNVWKVKAAPDGTVWAIEFEMYNFHLLQFDGESWTYHDNVDAERKLDNVRDIDIDADGVVWVGSVEGLNRYDGSWTRYDHPFIISVDAASDGTLWVGTIPEVNGVWHAGDTMDISYFKDGTWSTVDLNGRFDVPVYGVAKLVAEDDGSILFSVHHETNLAMSLYSLRDDALTHYTVDAPFSSDYKDIFVGRDGTVWLGTSMGLSRFDGESWDTTLFDHTINNIVEAPDGSVWFIGENGINSLTGGQWSVVDPTGNHGCSKDTVFDADGVLWGSGGSSLSSFDGTNWTIDSFPYDNGYSGWIYTSGSMALDANGDKWMVGVKLTGQTLHTDLLRYDGEWDILTQDEMGIEDNIYGIVSDTNGCLWLNCSGGLIKYDGAGFTRYDRETNRFCPYESNIGVDGAGRIWTMNEDYFSVYDGVNWDVYDIGSIRTTFAFSVFTIDSSDRLWYADRTSVRCYNLFGFPKVAPTEVAGDIEIPTAIALTGNYPNPFNPSTTIGFSVPDAGYTELTIYNAAGQKVRELVSGHLTPGRHSAVWDGRDNHGNHVSSGVYISRLRRGDSAVSRRMMLVK